MLHRLRFSSAILTLSLVLLPAIGNPSPAWATETFHWDRVVMPHATSTALAAVAARAAAIPGFTRQTGLPCAACHYQFPQLNAFGRMFKLNGYTLTTLSTIRAMASDTTKHETLSLLPIPPVSAMVVASFSRTNTEVPGTRNGTAGFPQQASIFLAGAITPRIGLFSQFTYAAADGAFGVDNIDIRFADHARVSGGDLLYGVTMNNNPTAQDVWNTVPAWGFPFMSSNAAPEPNASTLIEGALGQQVAGLGAYALWHNTLYTELTAYGSAPQGFTGPLDTNAVNTATGVIPYWRMALQHQFDDASYIMVGTYGLVASIHPVGISGPTNRHADVGVDAQFERPAGDGGAIIVRGNVIREHRRLRAFLAEVPAGASSEENDLTSVKVNATWEPSLRLGFTGGVFGTGGTADPLLYAESSVAGSPSTRGYIAEVAVNPWQNARLALQYVGYTRFNGASTNYDGAGRNASANGTLYLYTWVAF